MNADSTLIYKLMAIFTLHEPVEVRFLKSVGLGAYAPGHKQVGQASFQGGHYVVEIDETASEEMRDFAFAHELAHIQLGQVPREEFKNTRLDEIQSRRALTGRLPEFMRARYDDQERRADERARELYRKLFGRKAPY